MQLNFVKSWEGMSNPQSNSQGPKVGPISTEQTTQIQNNMPTPKIFGIKRRDAKSGLKIRVKPCDIRGAVCRDHQKCVVAKAILRQQGSTAKWVDVGQSVVLIGRSKKTADRYYLGGLAKEQIRFFDENEGRAAPCEVDLKSPLRHTDKHGSRRPLGSRKGEKSGSETRRRRKLKPTR